MVSKHGYVHRAVTALAVVAMFVGVGGVARADTEHSGIYVVNADGSERTRLTIHPSGDWHPEWSPDGTKIAFSRGGIHVANADGSDPRPLTNPAPAGYDMEPAWSPD